MKLQKVKKLKKQRLKQPKKSEMKKLLKSKQNLWLKVKLNLMPLMPLMKWMKSKQSLNLYMVNYKKKIYISKLLLRLQLNHNNLKVSRQKKPKKSKKYKKKNVKLRLAKKSLLERNLCNLIKKRNSLQLWRLMKLCQLKYKRLSLILFKSKNKKIQLKRQ